MKFLIAGDPNQDFLFQAIKKLQTIPHEAIFYESDSFKTEICYDYIKLENFIKDHCINCLIDATNDDNPVVSRNFFSIAYTLGIKCARLESPKFWHNPYMTAFPSIPHVAEALKTLSEYGITMLTLKAQDIKDLSAYFDEHFDYDLAPNEEVIPKILLACKDGIDGDKDHNLSKYAIVKQVQKSLPDTLENMDELYKAHNFNGLVLNDQDDPNERIIADWAIRNKIQTMCIYKSVDEPLKTFYSIIALINHLNNR